MIHALATEVQTAMRERGFPFEVLERDNGTAPTNYAREVIELSEKEEPETFDATAGTRTNPLQTHSVVTPLQATIYAKSPEAGALALEHRARARNIRDGFVTALEKVISTWKCRLVLQSGAFVALPDLEAAERWSGARYVLDFTVRSGVDTRKWDGEKRPEGSYETHANETKVGLTVGPTPSETACGGD